jgi:hypothetical protein
MVDRPSQGVAGYPLDGIRAVRASIAAACQSKTGQFRVSRFDVANRNLRVSLLGRPSSGGANGVGDSTTRGATANFVLNAEWVETPLVERHAVPTRTFPLGRITFETRFKVAYSGSNVIVRLPMTNGLVFNLYMTPPSGCRNTKRADFDRPVSFATVFGIVELPLFTITETVKGMVQVDQYLHGRHRPPIAEATFKLPVDGISPETADIPLKGKIPNTFVVEEPFGFLVTDSHGNVIIAGANIW